MDEYLVPTQFGEDEFYEKKSHFIGRAWPVETEEEALEKIQQMKKQHYDATHNCWAYIIRDGAVRFSDDGEPGGTAGMPMLQVLQREGLYNVVCVVTRYFGGILLGAGGLVRAYTKGAKIAVDAAGKSMKRVWTVLYVPCPYTYYERVKLEVEAFGGILLGAGGLVRAYTKGAKIAVDAAGKSMKRVWSVLYVPCPYSWYERVKLTVDAFGGIIRSTEFGADVELEILVPEAQAQPFLDKLTDLSAATIEGMETDQEYRAFPVSN